MRVLLTGATGLVGHPVALRLAARGDDVVALVRDVSRAASVLPADVRCVWGDLSDPASIVAALGGCEAVVHAAGMPEQWVADPSTFSRVNRLGTRHVLRSALACGVSRCVHISTMDVFAAPPGGTLREDRVDRAPKPTPYERSKVAAEREVDAVAAEGLDVVVINPSGVYGPSPSEVGLNRILLDVVRGRVPVLPPGGLSYVYNQGLADVILTALDRGTPGDRYLVSDGYTDLSTLAQVAMEASGRAGRVPRVAPRWLLSAVATAGEALAGVTGRPPLVASGELSFLQWRARVDAGKAIAELGHLPTSLEDGVAATLAWFRDEGALPAMA